MSRMLLVLIMLAVTAGAVVAYKDPERVARASDTLSEVMRERSLSTSRAMAAQLGLLLPGGVSPASSMRCARVAITACRSALSRRYQLAISGSVRPQP